MRAVWRLVVGALLLALGAGGACSSDSGKLANGGTGGIGGTGGGGGGLVGCLDMPGTLDRPPAGRLPCELIPPGLRL